MLLCEFIIFDKYYSARDFRIVDENIPSLFLKIIFYGTLVDLGYLTLSNAFFFSYCHFHLVATPDCMQ